MTQPLMRDSRAPTTEPGRRPALPPWLQGVATGVLRATREKARALTPQETHQVMGLSPESPLPERCLVDQAVRELVHRRVLLRRGPKQRFRYWHAEHPVPCFTPDEPEAAVPATVEAMYAAKGRAISTNEITRAMNDQGFSFDRKRPVDAVLRGATLPVRTESGDWVPGRLKMARRPQYTRAVRYWLPSNAPDEAPLGVASGRDAFRQAVQLATAELGRGVSTTELLWWRDAHPTDDPLASLGLTAAAVTSIASEVAHRSGRACQHPDDLKVIETAYTCRGGAQVRFQLGVPMEGARAMCSLFDALMGLRPGDELEELESLLTLSDWDSPVVRDAVALRRALLASVIRGERRADQGAVAALHAQVECLEGWATRAAHLLPHTRYYRLRITHTLAHHAAAVDRVLREPPSANAPAVKHVGAGAGLIVNAFESPGRAAAMLVSMRSLDSWRNLLLPARRFPDLDARRIHDGGSRFGPRPTMVDRVDAMLCFHDAIGEGQAAMLLGPARLLLGHVLRDATVLRGWLTRVAPRDGHTRRALVVALGLLGEILAPDEAALGAATRDDWEAWVFAVSLAEMGAEGIVARLREATRAASHIGRHVIDEARDRAEAGLTLSLIG